MYTDETDVLIIPQRTTYEIQGKKFVYHIGADSTLVPKEVKVRPVPGGQNYIVDEGLNAGENILLEGVGILTAGTKISPVKAE